MLGLIIGAVGIITYLLQWGKDDSWITVPIFFATILQFWSMNRMTKEAHGLQPKTRLWPVLNMVSTITIIVLFVAHWFQ